MGATVTTAEDIDASIDLAAHAMDIDSASPTLEVVEGPANGTVISNGDGTFSYTPDANYFGPDSFTFRANDGTLESNVSTVSISVTAVTPAGSSAWYTSDST